MDNLLFKHTNRFLCPHNKGGADKDNRTALLGPLMKTLFFQNSPGIPSSLHTQRPSAGPNGPHKDRLLTPYASEEEENTNSYKFHFLNMDPHNYDFEHHTFLGNVVCISIFQTLTISIPPLPAALTILVSVSNVPLSSSPLFHLSSAKWGIISLSIFPCSSPLLPYSTSNTSPPVSHIGWQEGFIKDMPFH